MSKNPFIGQMDRLVSLVVKKPTQSNTGAESSADIQVAEEWAFMQDVSGTEDTDGKIKHLINRTYTIRYNEDVKSKSNTLILIDDSQKYEVIHVIEIGRKKHLEIRVKTYV
jgi:hypothetical protein